MTISQHEQAVFPFLALMKRKFIQHSKMNKSVGFKSFSQIITDTTEKPPTCCLFQKYPKYYFLLYRVSSKNYVLLQNRVSSNNYFLQHNIHHTHLAFIIHYTMLSWFSDIGWNRQSAHTCRNVDLGNMCVWFSNRPRFLVFLCKGCN